MGQRKGKASSYPSAQVALHVHKRLAHQHGRRRRGCHRCHRCHRLPFCSPLPISGRRQRRRGGLLPFGPLRKATLTLDAARRGGMECTTVARRRRLIEMVSTCLVIRFSSCRVYSAIELLSSLPGFRVVLVSNDRLMQVSLLFSPALCFVGCLLCLERFGGKGGGPFW